MGRPRKRRREEEEGNETTEPLIADAHEANSEAPNSGIITPPFFQETNVLDDIPANLSDIQQYPELNLLDPVRVSPTSAGDTGLDPILDPSLWDTSAIAPNDPSAQVSVAPCMCLSMMYLTLTELQSIPSFAFPQVILPLRKAMGVLSDIIHCPQCPQETFGAIQNVQSIVTLFKIIIERFYKVLQTIDAEALHLEETGEKKPFRIGDNNPALFHLHTGTVDCPMGFNIEIESKEWKRLAKTAIKTEIYGNGSNPRPLLQLLQEATDRQKRWHEECALSPLTRNSAYGAFGTGDNKKTCEALGAERLRQLIDHMKWD